MRRLGLAALTRQWVLFWLLVVYGAVASVLIVIGFWVLFHREPILAEALAVVPLGAFSTFITWIVLKLELRRLLVRTQRELSEIAGRPAPPMPSIFRVNELEDLHGLLTSVMHDLAQSEARFRVLVETSSDVFVVLDREGTILYGSPSIVNLLGGKPKIRLGREGFELLHPEDRPEARALLQRLLTNPTEIVRGEYRFEHQDGGWRYCAVTGYNLLENPAINGLVVNLRDVHDRRKAMEALTHQALHDGLTGLPNRSLMLDRFDQALLQARRHQTALGFLMLDLDRFKEVNDTFGHQEGDLLLEEIGHRLVSALRDTDTVSRLGGDEFAVILPQVCDRQAAVTVAEKLLRAVQQPVVVDDHLLDIGVSIGVAMYPDDGDAPDILLQHADVAMYTAKQAHDGIAVYRPEADQHSVKRLTLAGELRHAIDNNELELYYQPKVALATDRVRGVEALARWNHPQRGFVPPDEFVGLAEKTGLIRPLTNWVLNTALRQAHDWRTSGLQVQIAVNLSMRNLHDPSLPDQLSRMLQRWQVDPSWISVEVTEGVLMADPVRAMSVVTRLHRMGIAMSIDDFGTGYSSLSYLTRLPVSEIKIDKGFVLKMLEDPSNEVIVHSTIDLAHNLGLEVVAEGVENLAALRRLAELGCDSGQGFHIGKPMPAAAFAAWLSAFSAEQGDLAA